MPHPYHPIESDVGAAPDSFRLRCDASGIWLITEKGLWRHDVTSKAAEWERPLGLPSFGVQEVVPKKNPNKAIAFTSAGVFEGHRELQKWWRFRSANSSGVAGSNVNAIAAYNFPEGGERTVVAIGTNSGVSVAFSKSVQDAMEGTHKWSWLTEDSGLEDNNVRSLHFDAEGRLWVGTNNGVAVFENPISPDGSWTCYTFSKAFAPRDGLPTGSVVTVTTSSDGSNAWLLVGGGLNAEQLVSWNAFGASRGDTPHVATPCPFLQGTGGSGSGIGLGATGSPWIRLGDWRNERCPQVLIRDVSGNWSTWNPGNYLQPNIAAQPTLLYQLWSTSNDRSVTLNSPTPGDSKVDIEWFDDNLSPTPWSLRIAPDVLPWQNKTRRIYAKLTQGQNVWYASVDLPSYKSSVAAWVRFSVLILPFVGCLVVLLTKLTRLRARNRRLKARVNPYVAGDVIKDADKFVGRTQELEEFKNSLGTNNYLILGERRSGKTSLQHQLTRVLRETNHPRYVFYPVFVDMQRFSVGDQGSSPGQQSFFHFLGKHLKQLAESEGVHEMADEEWTYGNLDAADYGHEAFERDLECLAGYFAARTKRRDPRIILQIDEIGILSRAGRSELLQWRSIVIHQDELQCVMSGVEIPHLDSEGAPSPWWNFMRQTRLGPMNRDEARSLIVEPARDLFKYDDDAVSEIMAEARYRPYQIQQLCADLLNYKYGRKRLTTKISLDDFQNSLKGNNGRDSMPQFVVGGLATGDNYYGRESELQTIVKHERVWILGQPRIGKSSLLHRAAQQLKLDGWIVMPFDLARIQEEEASGDVLIKMFLEEQRTPLRELGVELKLRHFESLTADKRFQELVDVVSCNGRKIAFLWDEAERLIDVQKNDFGFLDKLRAYLPSHRNFKLVLAATQKLSDLYRPNAGVTSFLDSFSLAVSHDILDFQARVLADWT